MQHEVWVPYQLSAQSVAVRFSRLSVSFESTVVVTVDHDVSSLSYVGLYSNVVAPTTLRPQTKCQTLSSMRCL